MEATSLKSLGGELLIMLEKFPLQIYFQLQVFSPNFGANISNPTSAQSTASVNIRTGFFVVTKVLCISSASSGCPLASVENLCVLNCVTTTSEEICIFAQNKQGKKRRSLNLTPSERRISLHWFLMCFSVNIKCYIGFI